MYCLKYVEIYSRIILIGNFASFTPVRTPDSSKTEPKLSEAANSFCMGIKNNSTDLDFLKPKPTSDLDFLNTTPNSGIKKNDDDPFGLKPKKNNSKNAMDDLLKDSVNDLFK